MSMVFWSGVKIKLCKIENVLFNMIDYLFNFNM